MGIKNKRTKILRAFCFIMLSCVIRVQAQNLTPAQTNRLFKTGQLWGHLNYFHPYLQYKTIAFDSAYAAAVPKIIAASSDTEWATALNEWLSVLKDASTQVAVKPATPLGSQKFESQFQTKKGIGVLTISGDVMSWSTILKTMGALTDTVATLRGLILDCREFKGDFGWVLEFPTQFFRGSIPSIGSRSVVHEGFRPEMGSSSGLYQTYFKYNAPKNIQGEADKERPILFVVSKETFVPEIAWAMQQAGKALIISNDSLVDKHNTLSYSMTDEVTVSMRVSEDLTGATNADFVLAGKESDLIEKAFELIEKYPFKPRTPTNLLPVNSVDRNPNYSKTTYPTIGYRALAAAKIYSVIDYFFPNKKLMTANWDVVTQNALTSIVLAKDSADFHLAVNALYAHIQDGHGYVIGSLVPQIFGGGSACAPISGKIVESKFVITALHDDSLAQHLGIQKGDIVLKKNGKEVMALIQAYKPYRAYSNEVTGTAYGTRLIYRGAHQTEAVFTIQKKDGKMVELKMPYDQKWNTMAQQNSAGRASMPILRFLTPEIGYADLDRLESGAVDSMFEMFKNTKSIVFDMRGYPKGTAWTIAPRLTAQKKVAAAKFSRLDVTQPKIMANADDALYLDSWMHFMQYVLNPDAKKVPYKGKTVMLIDEYTQSQAEHTGLFFRAANGTLFIGSQTAGANGDVTNFTIPGGMTLNFSGQTPCFPDGTPLQQTGLKPDIFIKPTLKGIQAGKDEVLERAILYLQIGR